MILTNNIELLIGVATKNSNIIYVASLKCIHIVLLMMMIGSPFFFFQQ